MPTANANAKSVRWDNMKSRWKKASVRKQIDATKEQLERWRWLMDPTQVTPKEFQELALEIKLSQRYGGGEFDDEDVDHNYAPFIDRAAQADLWETIKGHWDAGHVAKIVNLKARQLGMSYKVQSIMTERVLRHIGDGTTVCQDQDSTNEMHARLKEFIDQVPDWAQPERIKDRTEVIRFRHGSGKTSSVRVLTAGKDSLGRSLTNHWLHISEFAWWPEIAKKHLGGLLRTLHRGPGNFAVIECTARGYEAFYRRWKRAMEGKGGWDPKFYNWLMHPDYAVEFKSEAERLVFETSVGSLEEYGGAREITLIDVHGATLENLNFRRETIDGDLEGHLPTWDQEFPTVPDDAFVSTGRPVLPTEVLRAWLPLAEIRTRRAKRVDLAVRWRDEYFVEVQPNKVGGLWLIFEEPVEGEVYCFGVDVAKGYEVHADGKTEADFSSIQIQHILNGRVVAALHGHVFPRDLAAEIMKGSYLYGLANGYVERNMDGGEVISFLEEEEINTHSGAELLLKQRRIVRTDGKKAYLMESGFKTTVGTKKFLIGQYRSFLQDLGVPRRELLTDPEGWRECPLDERTIKESLFYAYTPTGAMGASEGHDDTVISKALCCVASDSLWDEVPTMSRVKRRDSPMLERLKRRVRDARLTQSVDDHAHAELLGEGF